MIYKLLPFKLHRWLILRFGKPVDFGCYKLGDWICGVETPVYSGNAWEIYKRVRKEINEAINKYCK